MIGLLKQALSPRGVLAKASSPMDAEASMDVEAQALRNGNILALAGLYSNPAISQDENLNSAAVAFPGEIRFHPDHMGNRDIQQHEFGHIGLDSKSDMLRANMLMSIAREAYDFDPTTSDRDRAHMNRYWGAQDNLEHILVYGIDAATSDDPGRRSTARTQLQNMLGREVSASEAEAAYGRIQGVLRDYGFDRDTVNDRRREDISRRARANFARRSARVGRAAEE